MILLGNYGYFCFKHQWGYKMCCVCKRNSLTFKIGGKDIHILYIQLVQSSIALHEVPQTENILFSHFFKTVLQLISQLLCVRNHLTILRG